jgi:hypothetical protein
MVPGDTAIATVTVLVVPEFRTLTAIHFRASGLGAPEDLDLPVLGPGSHEYRVLLTVAHLRIEGEIHLEATAQVEDVSDSDQETLVIADDGPPLVILETLGSLNARDRLQAPDSLIIDYVAVDTAGLDSVVVRVRGAIDFDRTTHLNFVQGIGERIPLWVPATASLGDSIVVEATAVDFFSKVTTQRRVVRVVDLTGPTIVPSVDTTPHPELGPRAYPLTYLPGDTLRVSMTVSDAHGLRLMGFQWLTFGDSTVTSGAMDSLRFEMVVPPGTSSDYALLEFFAVDSSGNRSLTRIQSVAIPQAPPPSP